MANEQSKAYNFFNEIGWYMKLEKDLNGEDPKLGIRRVYAPSVGTPAVLIPVPRAHNSDFEGSVDGDLAGEALDKDVEDLLGDDTRRHILVSNPQPVTEEGINNESIIKVIKEKCNSISGGIPLSHGLGTKICIQFFNLIERMPFFKVQKPDKNTYASDCGFLNYWLNYRIRNENTDCNLCVQNFYKEFKNFIEDISSNHMTNCHISDINENDFENMKLLYDLHNYYDKINNYLYYNSNDDDDKPCSYYIEKCISEYKKLEPKCPNNDVYFCKAFDEFKYTLRELYFVSNYSNKCEASLLKKLSELAGVSEIFSNSEESGYTINATFLGESGIGNKMKNLVISTVLSMMAVLFICLYTYKYTTFGPRLYNIIQRKIMDRKNMNNKNKNTMLHISEEHKRYSSIGEYAILYY
ncbi:variable surface protein [Plasmodium gonderi]|uniref:Variable surface protein n=1 Tax=Plasmodium gonderi TaxID=77519 RepID=A0A1Y1JPH7_PLAGO|nr:variable surface protein [Plasmodium gonderi]GAW82732.1 variable surface protein [Plasmodium gonderi]